jgi:hypothetical protein
MARAADLTDGEAVAVHRFVDAVRRAVGAESAWDASPGAPAVERHEADLVLWCTARGAPTVDVPIAELARASRKALVVVVRNPERVGHRGGGGDTLRLARELWSVGRVRDHAYLAVPPWASMLVAASRGVAPAAVAHAPVHALVRRVAPLHAFVVDTVPRTPQARRHLRVAAAAGRADV